MKILLAVDGSDYTKRTAGTHERSALAGVVLGSVATGVLARCTVPLLRVQ